MEAMNNYLDTRKIQHAKSYFDVTCCAVHSSSCTILYFIRPHIVCFILVVLLVAMISHTHVTPATVVALCLLSLVYKALFYLKIVYLSDNSCPNPWPPVCYSSLAHLEGYWITCMQVRTKHGRCPNLITFQHLALPGCYVNLVGECQSSVLLVVYQLHYS